MSIRLIKKNNLKVKSIVKQKDVKNSDYGTVVKILSDGTYQVQWIDSNQLSCHTQDSLELVTDITSDKD